MKRAIVASDSTNIISQASIREMTTQEVPDYYQSPRMEVVELISAAGARILDVGCAAGAMGAELKRQGALEVVGLEKFPQAAQLARTRLDAVYEVDLNTLPEIPFKDGYFDVVVFADVLEHLVEPAAALRHFSRYLSPQGQVLLSLPNVRHESVALPLLVDGRWQYQDMGILDRTHLRFFTLREMVALVKEAGLLLDSNFHAVRSEPSAYLNAACQFVQSLGGDAARFRDEATVIQFLLKAHKPSVSAWEGAHNVRVLLCPDWRDETNMWAKAITSFQQAIGNEAPVTFGVIVPSQDALEKLMKTTPSLPGHVMAIAMPGNDSGWLRVMNEASVFLVTADHEPLAELALKLKKEVLDGRKLGLQE